MNVLARHEGLRARSYLPLLKYVAGYSSTEYSYFWLDTSYPISPVDYAEKNRKLCEVISEIMWTKSEIMRNYAICNVKSVKLSKNHQIK